MTIPRAASTPAVRISAPPTEAPDDDEFLIELETALARPRARELQPFDAMTPLVSSVENRRR